MWKKDDADRERRSEDGERERERRRDDVERDRRGREEGERGWKEERKSKRWDGKKERELLAIEKKIRALQAEANALREKKIKATVRLLNFLPPLPPSLFLSLFLPLSLTVGEGKPGSDWPQPSTARTQNSTDFSDSLSSFAS
jgi:hypothetical protein